MKITGHKTSSIFRRYLIVDEELLAQATGAVAEYLEQVRRSQDDPGVKDAVVAGSNRVMYG